MPYEFTSPKNPKNLIYLPCGSKKHSELCLGAESSRGITCGYPWPCLVMVLWPSEQEGYFESIHGLGCKGYYKPGTRAWVIRGSRKIRIPVDMYPCRVEERLTIKLVKGEEVLKIETTVTAKDGTITKFPGKFPEYKPTKGEEEILKLRSVWEKVNYDISDSDSDLESTARSRPRDSEMEDTGSSGIRINA
ncbi:hypothetical protein Tco_1548125 [Tanacetum coccineum]